MRPKACLLLPSTPADLINGVPSPCPCLTPCTVLPTARLLHPGPCSSSAEPPDEGIASTSRCRRYSASPTHRRHA